MRADGALLIFCLLQSQIHFDHFKLGCADMYSCGPLLPGWLAPFPIEFCASTKFADEYPRDALDILLPKHSIHFLF